MPVHLVSSCKSLSGLLLREKESTLQVTATYGENADGLERFRLAALKCFGVLFAPYLGELERGLKTCFNAKQLLLCFVSIRTECCYPRRPARVELQKMSLSITTNPGTNMALQMHSNEPWSVWEVRAIPTFIIS